VANALPATQTLCAIFGMVSTLMQHFYGNQQSRHLFYTNPTAFRPVFILRLEFGFKNEGTLPKIKMHAPIAKFGFLRAFSPFL
jgi:hypothetical protein